METILQSESSGRAESGDIGGAWEQETVYFSAASVRTGRRRKRKNVGSVVWRGAVFGMVLCLLAELGTAMGFPAARMPENAVERICAAISQESIDRFLDFLYQANFTWTADSLPVCGCALTALDGLSDETGGETGNEAGDGAVEADEADSSLPVDFAVILWNAVTDEPLMRAALAADGTEENGVTYRVQEESGGGEKDGYGDSLAGQSDVKDEEKADGDGAGENEGEERDRIEGNGEEGEVTGGSIEEGAGSGSGENGAEEDRTETGGDGNGSENDVNTSGSGEDGSATEESKANSGENEGEGNQTDGAGNSENGDSNGETESDTFVMPTVAGKLYTAEALTYSFLTSEFYNISSSTIVYESELNGSLLSVPLTLSEITEEPQILIYHTHSHEFFADSDTSDLSTGIVGVGTYLTELLEGYGYSVLHLTDEFDYADGVLDRSKAYTCASARLKEVLEEYPSIEVMIDLHRDGVDDGLHLVTEINGKSTAMIMFFNGMSRTTSGNIAYLPNENLEANLAFSLQLKTKAEAYYPGFTRKNYIKPYRYNLHLLEKALLIEAGAQTNTFDEVKNAMEPLAVLLHIQLSGL